MLRAALAFVVLALVSMLFGAYAIAGVTMEIARILLVVFLVLAVFSLVGGVLTGRRKDLMLP